jgi:integrase
MPISELWNLIHRLGSRCPPQHPSPCNAASFFLPAYARLVQEWVASIGLDPAKFGTHSLRRTKAVLIYRRTGNLRAVQLLLGHSKIESTVRYLGIEVDDAIEIAEKIDI